MAKKKYKYDFKNGDKIIHSGITNNPKRREQEHKKKYGSGHLEKIGRKTTEKAARKWEKTKRKSLKSRRK